MITLCYLSWDGAHYEQKITKAFSKLSVSFISPDLR